MFIFILVISATFYHKIALGVQHECDRNGIVNGLANILHSMGVGFPILSKASLDGEALTVKFNLAMLIKTKSEWPTQPMDQHSLYLAQNYGIPWNSRKMLDMEQIVEDRMIKELASEFGTLTCTLRHVRQGLIVGETGQFRLARRNWLRWNWPDGTDPYRIVVKNDELLYESDGSNSYSSKSVNNYGSISDRESATNQADTSTERYGGSERSRNNERNRIASSYYDEERQQRDEYDDRRASRKSRNFYDQADQEYSTESQGSISHGRSRKTYSYEEEAPANYERSESRRYIETNDQSDHDKQTDRPRNQSRSGTRIVTYYKKEMPNKYERIYMHPSDQSNHEKADHSAEGSRSQDRNLRRTTHDKAIPRRYERVKSKRYMENSASDKSDQETRVTSTAAWSTLKRNAGRVQTSLQRTNEMDDDNASKESVYVTASDNDADQSDKQNKGTENKMPSEPSRAPNNGDEIKGGGRKLSDPITSQESDRKTSKEFGQNEIKAGQAQISSDQSDEELEANWRRKQYQKRTETLFNKQIKRNENERRRFEVSSEAKSEESREMGTNQKGKSITADGDDKGKNETETSQLKNANEGRQRSRELMGRDKATNRHESSATSEDKAKHWPEVSSHDKQKNKGLISEDRAKNLLKISSQDRQRKKELIREDKDKDLPEVSSDDNQKNKELIRGDKAKHWPEVSSHDKQKDKGLISEDKADENRVESSRSSLPSSNDQEQRHRVDGSPPPAAAEERHFPPFYSQAEIESSTLPVIECDRLIGHINVFVSVLYSFRMENSKVLFKCDPHKLMFDMRQLMTDAGEWHAIEQRVLDPVQLAYAEKNFMHLKPRGAGGKFGLNLNAFVNEPFYVRLIERNVHRIMCKIIDDKGIGYPSNDETKADEGDPTLFYGPKGPNKNKNSGKRLSKSGGGSSKSDKTVKKSSNSATQKSSSSGSNKSGPHRSSATMAVTPQKVENFDVGKNKSEDELLAATNVAKKEQQFLSNLLQQNARKSAALSAEYDCKIAEQFLKRWLSLREKDRGKRIELFITQNFIDQNSNGQNLLKQIETKNQEELLKIVEKCEKIIKEKQNNERTFRRRIGEQFDQFMALMEQTLNEQCKKTQAPIGAFPQRKNASDRRIELFWEENGKVATKSAENSDEMPFQKIAKQLIWQLDKLRGKFNRSQKKGRPFIALIEDIYFECSSPGLKSKISKIGEILKWNGLRDVSNSLRQRRAAMVNAWRRVKDLIPVDIMPDLVERSEEALDAVDRLLKALELVEIGTNLKQEFERLDADGGDTELNREDDPTKAIGDPEVELSEFIKFFSSLERNQLFIRQATAMKVSSNLIQESRILFKAARRAIVDNKHEIHGSIWDQMQSRKFEMPEAIFTFVKDNNKDGIADRLLEFLDELNKTNRFDLVKKFADQVDVYRDDPREEVYELWRKFTEGIDWIHRLNYGRKMVQFILILHRLVPKHSKLNQLKKEGKREHLEEGMPIGTSGDNGKNGERKSTAAPDKQTVLKGFKSLELETIYQEIKDQMSAQFNGWWKRVPEQKEPLYEFYKLLEDISTRYVLCLVDAFWDGISIESFRQEYSLGIKDVKIIKAKDHASDDESSSSIAMAGKLPSRILLEIKSFFDHFFSDQNLFDKESARFNLNNFMQTFNKSLEITAFITKGLNSVFTWSKRFIHELTTASSNDFEELSPLYVIDENNIIKNGKKKKFRKPLPPVLSKTTLNSIVKVIRMYELKFKNRNIGKISDQKILEMHWRKVHDALDSAAAAAANQRRHSAEDNNTNDEAATLTGTSSTETAAAATTMGGGGLLVVVVAGEEVPMDERQRSESLDTIEALVRAKRLLLFATILRRRYVRLAHDVPTPPIAAAADVRFGPNIDAAYLEVLRAIRRETERWVPGKREIKRLYRVCRHVNRVERVEITKLVDAYLGGQSADTLVEKRTKRMERAALLLKERGTTKSGEKKP